VPFGDQIKEPGGLGRLPRDRLPALARLGLSGRQRGAAAGGDRALLEDPGAEPGQVWLVSNALLMHIQCRCSASTVQL